MFCCAEIGFFSARRTLPEGSLDLHPQLGNRQLDASVDLRRHSRFPIEVSILVYPRNCAVVRGQTVDISESGISAMLRVEVPVGEVVRLEFKLPVGDVDIIAMVRQRNAFRYGFQFVELDSSREAIRRTCRELSMKCSDAPQKP